MNSRERVRKAINHEATDRVPIDLGATPTTGIHAVELVKLREHLGLEYRTPKVIDPMMFISEVDEDLRQALNVDVVGIYTKGTLFGYKNENYKPWHLPDGTKVMMGGGFEYDVDEEGHIYSYPQGDRSVPPSAYMTPTGLYFDNIVRQEDLSTKTEWNAAKDYGNMYGELTEEDLRDIETQADHYYKNTEYSVFGNYWNAGLGDALHVPGPWMKDPKGVRSFEDWYMYMYLQPQYFHDWFGMQTELSLKNLKMYKEAVGDKIDVMAITGVDFAHQSGLLISPDLYRDLFQPYYKKINDWIHENTNWKTFMHSCGSVTKLLPDIINTGFDIINPVQVSAADMDARMLKDKFGKDIVFWGGGCDPQQVLPLGTKEEVFDETKRNAEIFSENGGFVGGNVHNLQYSVPPENFMAEIDALRQTAPKTIIKK